MHCCTLLLKSASLSPRGEVRRCVICEVTGKRKRPHLSRRRQVIQWGDWCPRRLLMTLWDGLELTEQRRTLHINHSHLVIPGPGSWKRAWLSGLCGIESSSKNALLNRARVSVYTAILHSAGPKKPLCVSALVLPPAAWLTNLACVSTHIILELCPAGTVSFCLPATPAHRRRRAAALSAAPLSGAGAQQECLGFRPWLIFPFLLFFFSLPQS